MSPRNSQRVDRRRRVLADESRNEGAVLAPRIFRGESDGPTQRYNAAALQAINAPIARYIPLRRFNLVIWFLVGLIPILGLLLLDQKRPQLRHVLGDESVRAFSLTEAGNWVAWLSSVTFMFSVAVMLGTYSVRRHRRDDYRGRFTIWRWAILAAVLISIDATVGLHDAWQAVCEYVAGTPLLGDGAIWWVATWAVVFGGLLIRLLFEMSSSRSAVAWSLAAAACYVGSGLMQLKLVPAGSAEAARVTLVACTLLGHHLLLFSLVNYAREVVMEAMGLVESPAVRQAKARANKQAKVQLEASADQPQQTRKATGNASSTIVEPRLRAVTADTESVDAPGEFSDDQAESVSFQQGTLPGTEDAQEQQDRKLSKAERRRLRKEQRRRKAA